MYGSGIETPKVSFSSIDFTQITSGSYLFGFDLDNLGKLSKIDEFGNITVIEKDGGGGVIDLDTGTGSSVRICNSNSASGDYSTVSGGLDNTASSTYSTVGGGSDNLIQPFTTCSGYYVRETC
jgi:hypothetical protein